MKSKNRGPLPSHAKRRPAVLASSIAALLALGLAPSTLKADSIVVGAGPGGGPQVNLIDAGSGSSQLSFLAFSPTFTGGITVAEGDGEIVVGSGKGGGAVAVFDASGNLKDIFNPFGAAWTGGVNVAVADGKLVVGAGPGGQPQVQVYSDSNLLTGGTPVLQTSFDAFAPTFKGGVSVAIGDGRIAVGAGAGGAPQFNLYSDSTFILQSALLAFSPTFTGGVTVALGSGTVAVGAASGNSQVNLFNDSTLALQNSFDAFAPAFTGGVHVAFGDGLLAVSAGAGGAPQINVYNPVTLSLQSTFNAFNPAFKGGSTVALLPVTTTWAGTTSGNWNAASNWSPATVPNDFSANAVFGTSGQQSVSLSANTQVNSIAFTSNSTPAYSITANPGTALTISGTGITNTSGKTHNFVTAVDGSGNFGSIIFRNGATAGTGTQFTNTGSTDFNIPAVHGGYLQFSDSSSAGSATITNGGGAAFDGAGGATYFFGTSSAANATIANEAVAGGITSGSTISSGASSAGSAMISNNAGGAFLQAGLTDFYLGSTAGQATINNNAGAVSNALDGETSFFDSSSAGHATINNNANAGFAGNTPFLDNSTAAGAVITNAAATSSSTTNGSTTFLASSNAGGALIFNVGGTGSGAAGGTTTFSGNSSAGSAEFENLAGSGGGLGGSTIFSDAADGGHAAVINNGNGVLDISGLTDGGMKIGSLQGGGTFNLGANTLTIVGNTAGTGFTVSGVIEGTGGSLVLASSYTLTLSGTNTYTGTTGIINGSTLNANATNTLNGTPVIMDQTGSGYSTLNLGANQTILSLTGAASSTVNLNGNTLAVINSTALTTFAGVIADGTGSPGSGGLTVGNGAGTLILAGVNIYTGPTNVMIGGALQIGNGTSGNLNPASAVTVGDGALLLTNLGSGSLFVSNVALNGNGAFLEAIQSGTNFLSGSISGQGEFIQNTSATTILLGTNTYSGETLIEAGTLQIGTPGTAASIAGTSKVGIANGGVLTLVNVAGGTFAAHVFDPGAGGTLNVNSANTITLSGTLVDGGVAGTIALTKNGPGTAIISGTGNTYTGATTVNGGILAVTGSLGTTTVTVNKSAALGGQGTLGGNVFIETGASIETGGLNYPTTLSIRGNLIENSGAISIFRLGVLGGSDTVAVTGNLTLSGTLSLIPEESFGAGTYTLFTYGGSFTEQNFTLSVPELPGYTATLVTSTHGVVQVTLSLAGGGGNQNWNAIAGGTFLGGSGTWNNTSTIWTVPGNDNAVTTWLGGIASFASAAGTVTIPAATTINAQELIFFTDGYSISGASTSTSKLNFSTKAPTIDVVGGGTATINVPITSSAGLTANGTGTLVLANTANSISGNVSVVFGTLQLGTAAADGSIGSGTVTLNDSGSLTVMNVLNNTLPNHISAGLGQNGTVNFASSNTTIVSGALTDNLPGQLSINQSGVGLTVLTNSGNTNSGTTTISAGTLQIGTQTAGSLGPSSLVNFTGDGTLSLVDVSGNLFRNSVTVSAPTFASVTAQSKTTLTLSGALTTGLGGLQFSQNGPGTVILSGNNSIFSTTVNSGILQVGDGTTVWTDFETDGNAVQVNTGATLATNLAGGAIFADNISLNTLTSSLNPIQSGTNTLTGVISGTGKVNQTGTGTTVLANAETSTGATTISAGTLQIGNSRVGGLASSGVTVSGKGILALDLPTNSTFSTAVNLSALTTDVQAIQPGFLDITGAITGTGGFVQAGPGITEFDGMTAQFYHGPTNILAGTLEVETSLLNSPVNVQGGTLASFLGGAGIDQNITLSNNGTINFFSLAPSALSGTLTVTGTGGSWTSVATVAGLVTINAGNFNLGPNGAILTAPKGVIVSGGTISSTDNTGTFAGSLTYKSSSISTFAGVIADGIAARSAVTMNKPNASLILDGANTYTGPTTVTAGSLQIGNGFTGSLNPASIVTVASTGALGLNLYDSADFLNSVVLNGQLFAIQAGTTTLSVPISGTGGTFVQQGPGTTILSATETFTGTTNVNGGTLELDGVLPAMNTLTVNTGGTLTGLGDVNGNANLKGGTINLGRSGNSVGTILGTLTVNGGTWAGQGQVLQAINAEGMGPSNVLAAVFNISGNLTAVGGLTVSGTGLLAGTGTLAGNLKYSSSLTSTFGGAIVDNGGTKASVTMSSAKATLILNGTNTYTGPTTVTAGKLQIGDGTNGSISASSTVTVTGGELDLNLPSTAAFSNGVAVSSGATLETIGSGNFVNLGGVISGTGGFTQNGAGSTILNNVESYTGPTNVIQGGLFVPFSTAPGSTVTIGSNGALDAAGIVFGNVISSGFLVSTVNIAGTLTLTGGAWNASTGTVSGAVKVTSGNFSIGHGANLTAPMGLTVSGGTFSSTDNTGKLTGSLNYKSAFGSTFAGIIANGTANSTLTMASTNQVLTLSGMSTYTGATTVNAGALLVTGTLGDTPVTVNSGGYLAGTGTINGVETIKTGGFFVPGAISGPGTFTVGPLTLNSGANVNYFLGPAGTPSLDSLTIVNGPLALGGATLNITKQFGFGSGTYELFSATSAPTGTLTIGTVPTGLTKANFSIQIVGDQVNLVVNTSAANNAQYWNGAGGAGINGGSGTWDNTTMNWTNSTGTASASWTGAAGVFSAGTGTVTVGAAVTATSFGFVPGAGAYTIKVNTTNTLTISGAGITNTSGLTQNLETTTDASGNVGTIKFTNSATAGNVTITNDGGSVSGSSGGATIFSNTSTAGSATINNQGGTATGTPGGITTFLAGNAGSATINNQGGTNGGKGGATFFVGAVVGGTSQVINTGNGDFDISGMTAAGSVGSISGSGTFALGKWALTVGGNNQSTTVTGVIADGGSLGGTGGSLVKTGTGTLTLTGANTYTGATTVNAGTLQIGNGTTGAAALASNGVTVNNGGTLALDLKSGHSFANKVVVNTGGNLSFIGSGAAYTVSSTISGAGTVTQTGAVTTTLSAANIYSGATTVNAGTLLVTNTTGSATGTGPVAINTGAILGGGGKITGATTLNQGGDIFPGVNNLNINGVLGTTLTASSLIWNRGSKLTLQISSVGADKLALTGTLTKVTTGSGLYTLDIHDDGGMPLGNYTLATFASTTFVPADFTLELPGNYAGSLSITGGKSLVLDLTAGSGEQPAHSVGTDLLTSDNAPTPSTDSGSSLGVTPTPEPTSAALLAFGGAALLGWRRRRVA